MQEAKLLVHEAAAASAQCQQSQVASIQLQLSGWWAAASVETSSCHGGGSGGVWLKVAGGQHSMIAVYTASITAIMICDGIIADDYSCKIILKKILSTFL